VFVIDCGRGAPSAFADAGLDFACLEAVLITHLHADHTGDLPGMLLYPWGLRAGENGPLAPIRVYGPPRPRELPAGDATFRRETTVHPELPDPGIVELVRYILAAYAYHLNVMPLDAHMPDPGELVRAFEVSLPAASQDGAHFPVTVIEDEAIRASAVAVMHGRAVPAFAYRFDTPHGSVVFSGDTTVNQDLIALAQHADILVHSVADLDYLARQGFAGAALQRMTALHTDVNQVGGVAERCGVGELILTHYVPAEPDAVSEAKWVERARRGFGGKTTAGSDGLRRTLPA